MKENLSNKVSSWSATPDNNHYPTEKLVYDKCFKVDTYMTDTAEFKFTEHRMGNGLVLIEGYVKQFNLNGASSKSFTLTFHNNMTPIKIIPCNNNYTYYANIGIAVNDNSLSSNSVVITAFNGGSQTAGVLFQFMGLGVVQ